MNDWSKMLRNRGMKMPFVYQYYNNNMGDRSESEVEEEAHGMVRASRAMVIVISSRIEINSRNDRDDVISAKGISDFLCFRYTPLFPPKCS